MTLLKEWITDLDQKTVLSSQKYNQQVNKYKSKCGGSLGTWKVRPDSDADPYGWFFSGTAGFTEDVVVPGRPTAN
jgi:hypothetical protein